MSHRLFIGIHPPAPVRATLLGCMGGVDGARWQDDAQLHLTLRYIGEIEARQADDLADALSSIPFEPFELTIRSTGIFERKGVPHTVWAGVEPQPALLRLQRKVERSCIAVGLSPEHRVFHPHVTLARLNSRSGDVTGFLQHHPDLSAPPWPVDAFTLYESHLRAQGSLYLPIASFSSTR